MLELKILIIASCLALMTAVAIAQPPGLKDKKKNEKVTTPENVVITSDTLMISYDTTKVRLVLYCTDCEEPNTYLYFRDGYRVTKIWQSKNPQQKPFGIPYYFYKDWTPLKSEEAFDVRDYPWKK